jgi:PAS domain S-box-containing protein
MEWMSDSSGDEQSVPRLSSETAKQVDDLLSSPELAEALENEHFKRFLDQVPVAIVIGKPGSGEEKIAYVNNAFEVLTGRSAASVVGEEWSVLDQYQREHQPELRLGQAILNGEEFLGTFRRAATDTKLTLVEAYATTIDREDGPGHFRLVVLVDVTDRELLYREESERYARDKDTQLKELQHRVKNSLQIITALVRLEARNAREGKTVDFDSIASRIQSLSLLYDALSGNSNGQEVDVGEYLSKIASAAMSSYAKEGIVLDLKVESCMTSVNVAMPTGLVVNEIMTNAFKHAFSGRERGTITVRCLRHNDLCSITVADDGVGLQPALWPPPGKISTLIVQSLVENAKANPQIHSEPGRGTKVTFTVPCFPVESVPR